MNSKNPYARITFNEFKQRASNPILSKYEKIGFPDDYRKNSEMNIFHDLSQKLELGRKNITIADIGCGCSDLAHLLIKNSENLSQQLLMIDSQEMLDHLPNQKFVNKINGKFPDCYNEVKKISETIDVIIVYSVMQHIILDSNPFNFIDKALELLKPQGMLLLGDLPNNSKRNRFFMSEKGIETHKNFCRDNLKPLPIVNFPHTYETIDDGMILGILMRYRGLGFETYLLPQPESLPMSNRREDILIVKN
jgi:2-polyprenyl-3-methyl-5-hydroxy-6-metoxy-1,4-benzoquinol methylase